MKKPGKKQRTNSILALSLDASRLDGLVLRRTNGTAEVSASLSATLSVNPLSHDPELVGREIRQHLDGAGIRERRCAVCLPLGWAMLLQTQLPALPEADIPAFLAMEAERGFSAPPESLLLARSTFRLPNGDTHVTQIGISREHLERVERALRAARLIPVSFTLGLPILQGPGSRAGTEVVALAINENSVGILTSHEGGIVMLRAIDNAVGGEGTEKQIDSTLLAREIRITLGQLPETVRVGVSEVRLYGEGVEVDRLASDIAPRLQAMGLVLHRVTRYAAGGVRRRAASGGSGNPGIESWRAPFVRVLE